MSEDTLYEWLEKYEENKNITEKQEKNISIKEKLKIVEKNVYNLESKLEKKLFLKKLENVLNNENETDEEIENTFYEVMDCFPISDYYENKDEYLKLLDISQFSTKKQNITMQMWFNFKLGLSELFNKKYIDCLKYFNTARDYAKQNNKLNIMLLSTLMIANALTMIGKYAEAIQLIDMLKIEAKTFNFINIFDNYKSDTIEIPSIKNLYFSDEFYQEIINLSETKKLTTQFIPATKQTVCSKIKENQTFKMIESTIKDIKHKFTKLFEK